LPSPALGFFLLAFAAPVVSLVLAGVGGKPLIAALLERAQRDAGIRQQL